MEGQTRAGTQVKGDGGHIHQILSVTGLEGLDQDILGGRRVRRPAPTDQQLVAAVKVFVVVPEM